MTEPASHCRSCGNRADGGTFCEYCGARLVQLEDSASGSLAGDRGDDEHGRATAPDPPTETLTGIEQDVHRSRGRMTAVAIVLLLASIGGGVGAFFALRGRSLPPLTTRRAATLSRELSSGQAAELRDAVAVPTGVSLDRQGMKQLAGRSFTFDATSFRRAGGDNGYATVRVDSVGRSAQQWQVALVYTAGQWRLDDTRQDA